MTTRIAAPADLDRALEMLADVMAQRDAAEAKLENQERQWRQAIREAFAFRVTLERIANQRAYVFTSNLATGVLSQYPRKTDS